METLLQYVPLIIAVGGAVMSFAAIKTQNIEQDRRIEALEDEVKVMKDNNKNIDVKLAEIQKDIQWIKQALSK